MVIARIKGLKISQADERHNPTGEEMIPFQDGSKNGRIRMADFKGMALHVLDTKDTLSTEAVKDLQDAINAGKVIFIPNRDNTGLKVVTEVYTKNGIVHLESPDYELEANGDKISKVWFDTVDIDTSTKQVTRSTRETTALKTKGSKTDVLTANGSYTPINEIALVKVNFKTGEVTKSYDLTSTGITFRDNETPSVHWEVEKDGDALFMNLKIDKATQTLDGLMSKEDKFNLDVTIPGDIDALNKRCNRLRKSINQTKEALQSEVETRTKEVARLDGKINDEAEHREHGDAELKALLKKETEDRIKGDSTFQERLESAKNELDRKYESKTSDLETKLSKEITDRTEADATAKKLFDDFKAQKGKNGGLAELGSDGKIPAAQLPSYVDDVKEFVTKDGFPTTGETGIIYVDTTTNLTYRWSGTEYVEISQSLALGETASTAFPGNRGKALEEKLNNQPNTIVTRLTDPTTEESQVKINYKQVTKNDSGYGTESPQSITIPAATSSHAGVMTADDKKKYDGLDSRITKEADRATEAEERLQHLIEANDSKSNAADQALRQEIEKERTARENAIDTERNRATQKENELDSEIDTETERATAKEKELDGKITQEKNDRTTIDTQLQNKNTEQDTAINELKKKDQTHDSKLQDLESKLTNTTNNPITISTTGNGNAITKATLSGKALTFSKETTFVDTTSAQTISGVKTFTQPQLFGENSGIKFIHPYAPSGQTASARGLYFMTHDWGSYEAGIGTLDVITTNSTALNYIYLGWGTSPWNKENCLAVANDKLTYKNKRIVYEDGANIFWNVKVKHAEYLWPQAQQTSSIENLKGSGIWPWGNTNGVTGTSSWYGVVLQIQNSDSTPNTTGVWTHQLQFQHIANSDAALYIRSCINNEEWKPIHRILTADLAETITGVKTFTQSQLFDSSSILIKNRASGGNATGMSWKNNDWSSNLYSIGCFSSNNTGHYGYMGWGDSPWQNANNLTVSDTKLTYKNNDVLYNNYASAITFTGSGSVTAPHFYKQSDARLKSNIQPLTHTLDQICSIPTISFDLNNDHRIGTTAQALEELGFNELVTESETLKSEIANPNAFESFTKDDKEYVMVKKVEYDNLSVLALEGIKLLRKEIEQLKASVYGNK